VLLIAIFLLVRAPAAAAPGKQPFMDSQAVVYIALGSNLGDRAANLHAALVALREHVVVEATSFMVETAPAYVTDQPYFLNAVCRVRTALEPLDLLHLVKQLEQQLGRTPSIRFGPRVIDLDILLYDSIQIDLPPLTIPHPRMQERAFVLAPLCDLAPDLQHPVLQQSMAKLLEQLHTPPLTRVMPVGPHLWHWGSKSYIMGILNITPDSFSGDGLYRDPERVIADAVAQAEGMVAAGADCLDVGGQSTRPGHNLVSEEDELARVVPVISALASAVDIPISVDTFRAPVARAALNAGAHMINDIWGLRFDPAIAGVAAEQCSPLVIMHNRAQITDPSYPAQLRAETGPAQYADIVAEIAQVLEQQFAQAEAAGVPRWHLIADPGIGFGKAMPQTLELMHRLEELAALGYPILFGPSRKSFIGKMLGDLPASERVEGTIAACLLAAERGASILRVHDVQAVARAARFLDIFRSHQP
jgi:dihydropteroate synthase/2-amino-4-hydroxy-6-hydroxymethyldihydropteridine diphosphokinase